MPVVGSGTRAAVVSALAIYYRHEPEKALDFCDQIKRGVGLHEHDPAYRLRLALKLPAVKGGAQGSIRAFSYTASAIVAHSEGRQMKLLKGLDSWDHAPWKEWKA